MRKKTDKRPVEVENDYLFLDDDERQQLIGRIIQLEDQNDAIEALAFMLIELLDALKDKRADRRQTVIREIEGLIEATFRQSLAYGFALELYRSRLDIKGPFEPNDLIRELTERWLPGGKAVQR